MGQPEGRPRPPSIRDVADRAGVSYQTVSRVLNEHPRLKPTTVTRVRSAIEELGYRPNRAARALVTSRTRTIGVLLSARALYGPFSSFVAIVAAARERGYTVTSTPISSDDPADITEAVEELLAHGVDGIVAIAPQDRAREAVHRIGAGIPVLTLQGAKGEEHGVGFDQREGVRAGVRHLVEAGHERIVHLPGPSGWAEAEERLEAFDAAMREHGLTPRYSPEGDWTTDSGREIAHALLQRDPPSAVFAANDDMAIGVLAAARDLGLHVPADLSIMGFDDVPHARHLRPALTTIRLDFGELGARAIGALLDELEQTVTPASFERVRPRLIVRQSTAQVTIRSPHARSA